MKIRVLLSLSAITVAIYSLPTYAWNALGHQVIAHIAYQQLDTPVKKKVDALIADFNNEYADIDTLEALAVWPDAIRSQKIETYTRWHYIDMPIIEDGIEVQAQLDTDNAVWAIEKIKPVVENNNANQFERARFLAFLTHIVGDLHQPLHTVALFSSAHPKGDRGGNAYSVYYHNKPINLHALWDRGVGAFEGATNLSTVNNLANKLMHNYPKAYFAERVTITNPTIWVNEGMKNARNSVYTTTEGQDVSQEYIANGNQLAEEEATLAGYRLGMILNQLLG